MSEYVRKLRPRPRVFKTDKKAISPEIDSTHKTSKPVTTKKLRLSINKITKKTKSLIQSVEPTKETVPARRRKIISKGAVNQALINAGVEFVDDVCLCLKAALRKGYYSLRGDKPLDQVILTQFCPVCKEDEPIEIKLDDVLFQANKGDPYWGFGSDIECTVCESQLLVKWLCRGTPTLCSGRHYNHCDRCPGFGKCIGNFRSSHCDSCDKHYYAGCNGELSCSICYSTDEDTFSDEDILTIQMEPPPTNPIFSYVYRKKHSSRENQLLIHGLNFPSIDIDMADSSDSSDS